MRAKVKIEKLWAAKSDETNRLDGRKVRLRIRWWNAPKQVHGQPFMLFHTRRECRAWITEEFGYIRRRPDLQAEPHGWRVPKPVRVTVTVTEVK